MEKALAIAARVIGRSSRERPADAALRDEFRKQAGLSRALSGDISRAVFAYFRWLGWLDREKPMAEQITAAEELQQGFNQSPQSFSDEKLMARAVPEWVAKEVEVSAAWLRALQGEPQLWLRARPGQGSALEAKLGECRVAAGGALAETMEYRGVQDLFRTSAFQAGEFEVQDISSQLAGLLCDPKPGETWWDACAGEGGKLLHLSDLMQNRGLIWASDRAAWRLKKLKQRAARAKVFNYRAVRWDGSAKLPTKTKFDGVLVDAPCSGVGTWQRNPHARWTMTENDVRELSELQAELLSRVAGSVKPGGKLVYAVCTLTQSETVNVAGGFAGRHPEFQPWPVKTPWQPKAEASAQHCFWPQEQGGNGMFVACWRRAAASSAHAGGKS
ncbi:MAG TPA: RsmB/NOP family class I SAM-dependent RNA methyltransferase [Verrucomicrobiae bacterium]